MSAITIPAELVSLLENATEATVLRDAQGNDIGVFTPQDRGNSERLERLKALFDLEEAERIAATERHGYSIAEVKEYLESLESR